MSETGRSQLRSGGIGLPRPQLDSRIGARGCVRGVGRRLEVAWTRNAGRGAPRALVSRDRGRRPRPERGRRRDRGGWRPSESGPGGHGSGVDGGRAHRRRAICVLPAPGRALRLPADRSRIRLVPHDAGRIEQRGALQPRARVRLVRRGRARLPDPGVPLRPAHRAGGPPADRGGDRARGGPVPAVGAPHGRLSGAEPVHELRRRVPAERLPRDGVRAGVRGLVPAAAARAVHRADLRGGDRTARPARSPREPRHAPHPQPRARGGGGALCDSRGGSGGAPGEPRLGGGGGAELDGGVLRAGHGDRLPRRARALAVLRLRRPPGAGAAAARQRQRQ